MTVPEIVHSPLIDLAPRYVGAHTMCCPNCGEVNRKPSSDSPARCCGCGVVSEWDRTKNAAGQFATYLAEIYKLNQNAGEELLRVLNLAAPAAYLVNIGYVEKMSDDFLSEMEWQIMELHFIRAWVRQNQNASFAVVQKEMWQGMNEKMAKFVNDNPECYDSVTGYFHLPAAFGGVS